MHHETHDRTASQLWREMVSQIKRDHSHGTHSEREHAVVHLLPQVVLCPLVLVHNLLQTFTLSCSRVKLCPQSVQSHITLLYIMSVGGGRREGRGRKREEERRREGGGRGGGKGKSRKERRERRRERRGWLDVLDY